LAVTALPNTTSSPRPQQWGLWLAILLALFLRLFRIGHQSLWVDEVFTWYNSAAYGPLVPADVLSDRHGALMHLLVHAWSAWFGDAEGVMRVPMALATVALVPAVAALARRVAGEAAVLPAAFLVALSPFVTWYGQELRGYAFVFLWSTLALCAALDYRAHGRTRDLALLALWSAICILSNLNGALLVPVTFGGLALSPPPGRRRLVPLAVALAAVGLVLLPWILNYFHIFEFARLVPGRAPMPEELPLRGLPNFAWPAIPYTFLAFSVGYTLGPSLRLLHAHQGLAALRPFVPVVALSGLAFGTLAVCGLRVLARRRFALALLAGALFAPMALVTWFALQNFKTFNPRYLVTGFPGWIVLLAAGFVALSRPWRALVGGLVVVLCVLSLGNEYFVPAYGKEDFRGATAFLRAQVAPGDSLVAGGNHSPLDYYWRDHVPGDRAPRPRVFWLGYAQDARLEPHFTPFVNRTGGATWVVVSRPENEDPGGRFTPWLLARYRPEVHPFAGVTVYRIPPEGPPK